MLAYTKTIEVDIQLLADMEFQALKHEVTYEKFDVISATLVLDDKSVRVLIGDSVFEVDSQDVIALHPENGRVINLKETFAEGELVLL